MNFSREKEVLKIFIWRQMHKIWDIIKEKKKDTTTGYFCCIWLKNKTKNNQTKPPWSSLTWFFINKETAVQLVCIVIECINGISQIKKEMATLRHRKSLKSLLSCIIVIYNCFIMILSPQENLWSNSWKHEF